MRYKGELFVCCKFFFPMSFGTFYNIQNAEYQVSESLELFQLTLRLHLHVMKLQQSRT